MTGGDNYITLRWLTTIGGWDSWTFTARHSYGYNISNVETFDKDIFDNWDTDYIAGKIEQETLSLDANATITLRSGFLNEIEINGLAPIKFSKRIEAVSGDGVVSGQAVRIDRGSFTYRTDKEKLIEFEFQIILPTIQIQTA